MVYSRCLIGFIQRAQLFTGTVPANKNYVTGTVPANKNYGTGTVKNGYVPKKCI
jgi:hypothetical protein